MDGRGRGKRFQALDSLRGICACIVVVHHASIFLNWSFHGAQFLLNAYLFVDFFFVLSGFVIASSYEERLGQGGLAPFLIRRIGRVYPLHLAMLLFLIAERLAIGLSSPDAAVFDGEAYTPSSIGTNLLLVHAMATESTVTWNVPSWSISTELYTYVVFGLIWTIPSLAPGVKGRLLWLYLALAASLPIILLLFSQRLMGSTVYFGFARCLYGFAVGVLAFNLHRFLEERPLPLSLPQGGAGALEVGLAIACVLFVWGANGHWWALLSPPLFAVVVLVFARERGSVSRLLLRPLFLRLGLLSYSIYMIHWVLLTNQQKIVAMLESGLGITLTGEALPFVARVWKHDIPVDEEILIGTERWIGDLVMVANVIAVVLLAKVTYALIETPGRDLAHRLARAWQARAARRPALGSARPQAAPRVTFFKD